MKEIAIWLSNRQRKYADGLDLFKKHASEDLKKKHLSFFSEVSNPPQFDTHFSVLINKLNTVLRTSGQRVQVSTSEAAAMIIKTAVNKTEQLKESLNKAEGERVLSDIKKAEQELFELQDRIEELEDDNDDKSGEIEELEAELGSKNEELLELQDRLSQLRTGVKIVTYSALPDEMKFIYNRIREITPLYASLFTEMSDEKLTPEEREPIAQQVNSLYLERAELWNKLDTWAEGRHIQLDVQEQKTEDLQTDDVHKGMQIANRIERLKENIRRTEVAIRGHIKNGKENLKIKAEQRLEDYKKELSELEKMK